MARGRTNSSGKTAEFLGLAAFALAALVTISLLSFDPLDRSFFVAPPGARGPTHNLVGSVGANLAHALLYLFGLLAYLSPVVLVLDGVRRLKANPGGRRLSLVAGLVLLWLSVSAILAVTLGDWRFAGSDGRVVRTVPIPAGGIVGQSVAAGLGSLLGTAGSLVVLLTTLSASLLLTTPISFARAFDRTVHHAQALGQRTAGAVRRVLERRSKQKARASEALRAQIAREREDRLKREAKEKEDRLKREAKEKDERARIEADARARRDDEAARERTIAEAARVAAERRAEQAQSGAKAAAAGARKSDPLAAPAAPAAPVSPAALPLARPALRNEAERALARDQAARAAAVTLRLDQTKAAEDRAPAAPAPPAAALAAKAKPVERPAAATRATVGSLPTPSDVAALAAAASGAMRKARAEADEKKKPADRAKIDENFDLPPLSLLETVHNDAVVTERELVENAKVLVAKLNEFAVDGTVQAIHPGPVVTTYEYRPEAGVKYSKIVGLADDLCLAMKAEGVRIDRVSGKSAVGIEVPNSARETIGLKEMLEADYFQKSSSKLTLALGKGISGEPYVTDLRKMPHLLVAGATGSGKSVAVNCMIVSILYKARPEEVKFIMVDPKRIELGVYDGIPHLLVPVVTDCRLASNALRWAVVEMENRYKRLASFGVRSLEQFNSMVRGPEARKLAATATPQELEPLPYLVILIDELADLMMVAANDIEDSISRLAAMARAVGIHLVLATQRPSVDVITGVIKANFPSRISFRVSSKVDSRTILDSNGAEMLLGKGDMLFMPPGSARLLRVHGAFISDGEVQRLVNYLKNQREPQYNDEVLRSAPESEGEYEGEMDEMYDDAVRVVLETGQASVSHLQRRLRLGYSRAARLVDMMELNGIVGPSQGAKGREILVDRARFLAELGSPSAP
jgi:S-DNA-T family DNA segregation ATPase FtsK/SpoIIIE